MTGIAHPLDTTFEVLEFFGRLSLGAQQMGNTKNGAYKAKSEDKLDTDREITGRIIQVWACYLQ